MSKWMIVSSGNSNTSWLGIWVGAGVLIFLIIAALIKILRAGELQTLSAMVKRQNSPFFYWAIVSVMVIFMLILLPLFLLAFYAVWFRT